jgi:hypothetical protein
VSASDSELVQTARLIGSWPAAFLTAGQCAAVPGWAKVEPASGQPDVGNQSAAATIACSSKFSRPGWGGRLDAASWAPKARKSQRSSAQHGLLVVSLHSSGC